MYKSTVGIYQSRTRRLCGYLRNCAFVSSFVGRFGDVSHSSRSRLGNTSASASASCIIRCHRHIGLDESESENHVLTVCYCARVLVHNFTAPAPAPTPVKPNKKHIPSPTCVDVAKVMLRSLVSIQCTYRKTFRGYELINCWADIIGAPRLGLGSIHSYPENYGSSATARVYTA